MNNIVEFSPSSSNVPDGQHCWLCQKPLSLRALFCHQCGTIQPVREANYFERLNLEKRVDIDIDQMDRHYLGLKRALDPARFSIRGTGERGLASKHLEAIEEAYTTLRDPVRRGRYWLVLHEQEEKETEARTHTALVSQLLEEFSATNDALICDQIARKAGKALEDRLLGFLQNLRIQNWGEANAALGELSGLESLLNDVRQRRAVLAASAGPVDVHPRDS